MNLDRVRTELEAEAEGLADLAAAMCSGTVPEGNSGGDELVETSGNGEDYYSESAEQCRHIMAMKDRVILKLKSELAKVSAAQHADALQSTAALQNEKDQHTQTKLALRDALVKLETVTKSLAASDQFLAKEKRSHQEALAELANRSSETARYYAVLDTKCNEMQERVREQEAMLIVKDTQNADLIEKLERSRAEHRRKRDDAAITQQQLEFFQKTVKRSVTKKKSEVGR